jgi:DNA-binding protein H-NS
MTVNLRRLSLKQLDDLARAIEAHRLERRTSHLAVVRAKAEAMARAAGLSLADAFPQASPKQRPRVAPKYRNPADTSQTWSGRGRQPRWFKAALRKGKTERSLLIP